MSYSEYRSRVDQGYQLGVLIVTGRQMSLVAHDSVLKAVWGAGLAQW